MYTHIHPHTTHTHTYHAHTRAQVMAPVKWDIIDLEFKAGFLGAEQREDGVIAPVLGWYIQHKPPKRPGWDDDDE